VRGHGPGAVAKFRGVRDDQDAGRARTLRQARPPCPPVADYADFIPYLRSLGWWVGLAPLEDNAFNRCKADTKWVEYSLAGMAVVASDTVVYRRACGGGAGLVACGPAAGRQGILDLLLSPALRAATIIAAQRKLEARYTHEQLRRQVLAVFSQAFELARQSGRVRDA
jgi:hypothetical protein